MAQKEGRLYLNENGRLALDAETEFHCGDVVEVLLCNVYITVRIEMNMRGEWYFVGLEKFHHMGFSPIGEVVRYGAA